MSKKAKIGYIGIGVIISIVVYLIFVLVIIMDTRNDYLEMTNNGMSPTISKGEFIQIDWNVPFSEIVENDIIGFSSSDYPGSLIIHRVTEKMQEHNQLRTQADNMSDSILPNSIVTEEQYEGKITNIYPDLDATRNIQSSIFGEVVIMP